MSENGDMPTCSQHVGVEIEFVQPFVQDDLTVKSDRDPRTLHCNRLRIPLANTTQLTGLGCGHRIDGTVTMLAVKLLVFLGGIIKDLDLNVLQWLERWGITNSNTAVCSGRELKVKAKHKVGKLSLRE